MTLKEDACKITYTDIKTQFPNPVVVGTGIPGSYCVGGAFLEAVVNGNWDRFPGTVALTHTIAEWRKECDLPAIPNYKLRDHVKRLIRNNDRGKFDKAWAQLERLMS